MSASVEWNGGDFLRDFNEALTDSSFDAAVIMQTEIKKKLNLRASNIGSGGKASPPGSPPAKRTGTLGRSMQMDTSGMYKKGNPVVRVGSNLPYALIHEFGGRIEAGSKLLAIPVNREAQLSSPRDVPGLSFVPVTKSTNIVGRLVRRSGKGKTASLETFYLLARRVTLPARPYLRPALRAARPKIIDRTIARLKKVADRYAG